MPAAASQPCGIHSSCRPRWSGWPRSLEDAIQQPVSIAPGRRKLPPQEPTNVALKFLRARFFPEMLETLTAKIQSLITADGLSPAQIVILGPFLSDALRFALSIRLQALGVPVRTHRPSRSLRDEPPAGALLTLAALAHPHWNSPPPSFDVVSLFMTALGMDLVRAHLLTEIVFRKGFTLLPFGDLNDEARDRITVELGSRYSRLRDWLMAYRDGQPQPLDYFFRRVFGEVLSQPGFGFHGRMDEVRVAGSLVESVRKFRMAMEPSFVDMDQPDFDIGREFMRMLDEGVLAAQYLQSWSRAAGDAVLIAPAYSFLMMNRAVAVSVLAGSRLKRLVSASGSASDAHACPQSGLANGRALEHRRRRVRQPGRDVPAGGRPPAALQPSGLSVCQPARRSRL